MADFCKQCADELRIPTDLDNIHFDKTFVLEKDCGWPALCEGCGTAIVDWAGQCIALNCDKQHGKNPPKVVYTTYTDFIKAKEEGKL